MTLEKFSIGIGDRFGKEGVAQLRAFQKAEAKGVRISPVWNKSFREHSIIGTKPDDVRVEADDAVRRAGWNHPYYVDADHIGMKTVDGFLASSNFFTLDVADFIGKSAADDAIASFVRDMAPFKGRLTIPGVPDPFEVTEGFLETIGRRYVYAISEAGVTYRHIASKLGADNFVPEVSVDETLEPQLPFELFFLLAAISREKIPVQTIAPKFSGKFLKGVDYVGTVSLFEREFSADLAVIKHAVSVFGLPQNLKVSVHSGSDKFSLYPVIRTAIAKGGAGLHLKTAGTTWLEELLGVALAGPNGLDIAKRVYLLSLERFEELCKPYATVVEIDRAKLPTPAEVKGWTGEQYASRLRHDQKNPAYNVHMRQLVHVGYKVAAEMGAEWMKALDESRTTVERCVEENIYDRHIQALFLG